VEIGLSDLHGKWKASQNRNAADRAGVIEGLADDPMAAIVRNAAP
jgi:transcriptional regulator